MPRPDKGHATLLRNARIAAPLIDPPIPVLAAGADAVVTLDLLLSGGQSAPIMPPGSSLRADGQRDLRGGLVLPGFVDIHTHIDKGAYLAALQEPRRHVHGCLAGGR